MTATLPLTLTDLGQAPGRCVGADPSGRLLALQKGRQVTLYDTSAALAPRAAFKLPDDTWALAVHPSGEAIARLTTGWALELRHQGRRARRLQTPIKDSPLLTTPLSLRWGVYGAGWVQFTGDGAWLLVGDVEGPRARVSLYDAQTLRLVDQIPQLASAWTDEPLTSWGEGVYTSCAPAPSTAVAFTCSAGDDTLTLGVAEVIDGRLHLHGVGYGPDALCGKIPGEVIHSVHLTDDALIVIDSDQILTALRWRDPALAARRLTSGYDLSEDRPPQLAGLYPEDDTRLALLGPFAALPGLLLLAVERETLVRNSYHWSAWGYLCFDADTLALRGWSPAPARDLAERADLTRAGALSQRRGAQTRLWRLGAP